MKQTSTTLIDKLMEHLHTKGKDRSWDELTKFFNGPYKGWAKSAAQTRGWFDGEKEHAETVEDRIHSTKHQSQSRRYQKDIDALVQKILRLERTIELFKDLEGYRPQMPFIPAPKDHRKGQAAAIIQWSDWHLDERVRPETVNFLNEYNDKIAAQRCANLFQNGVKLTDTQRGSVDIPYLVLQLGGDFIGNYLHPELEQTNTMGPMQAVEFAIEQICTGIDYTRRHGGFKHMTVVTNRGNHGRLTDRMQYANDYALNLETIIYCMVKKEFKKEKGISWVINEGDLNYYQAFDRNLRFFHGHQVKFKGGIGGLTIPLYKAIHRWNGNKKAFYNFMCDKHSYQNATPDCQVNGSLKGFDAYANSLGCEYQPPLQSFSLLDSRKGITIKAPIFCD